MFQGCQDVPDPTQDVWASADATFITEKLEAALLGAAWRSQPLDVNVVPWPDQLGWCDAIHWYQLIHYQLRLYSIVTEMNYVFKWAPSSQSHIKIYSHDIVTSWNRLDETSSRNYQVCSPGSPDGLITVGKKNAWSWRVGNWRIFNAPIGKKPREWRKVKPFRHIIWRVPHFSNCREAY